MKVATVVGARPQFIKLGPVSRALRKRAEETLIHTGQHYDDDMSEVFFRELDLPRPDVNLEVGSASHGRQTGRMLEGIETVLEDVRPDWVLVYGDTNSTVAGALAAAKLHIPVAHVEAGLRSFNRAMPEEINRVVADHLASFCFAPTQAAVDNLAREGITEGVGLTGDVMLDAVQFYAERADDRLRLLDQLGVPRGEYAVLTVHRAENTDDPEHLQSIIKAVCDLPFPVVFPVHPRTMARLRDCGLYDIARGCDNLRLCNPLGYLETIAVVKNSRLVVTDSGGLQKEAFFLGRRCITLRDETEWMETVTSGWNTLAGLGGRGLARAAAAPFQPLEPASTSAYGDGHAAERIAQALLDSQGE